MVELKSLTSPKVAVPILGIVVLIVVSTLVAVFYIRNPTVTDNLFGGSNEENTTLSSRSEGGMLHVDHATQTGNLSDHSEHATTPGAHDTTLLLTTTSSTPTLPPTAAPESNSTPMHAIEPVQHL